MPWRTTTQRRSSEISFPFPHLRRLSLARRVVESVVVDGSRWWWSMAVVVVVDGSRGGGCGRDVVRGCCVGRATSWTRGVDVLAANDPRLPREDS